MIISKTKIAAGLTAAAISLSGPAAISAFAAPPGVQQITQGTLIAALNNINVQIERLNALNNLTIEDVQVVNVEDVLNNNNVLNNALNRNNVEILNLRNILNNSLNNLNVEILNDALDNLDINIDDVVAINVLSDGGVVVFID